MFIKRLASQIKEKYHPQTVLDAGCAMGMLVAALRDLGVEAYGVDLSEYAISQVREDIRPYCAVGSPVSYTHLSILPWIKTINMLK